jgi:FkbM family methyltransferase
MIKSMPASSAHPIKQLEYYLRVANSLGSSNRDKLNIFWKKTKNLRVRLGIAQHNPDVVYGLNTRYGQLYFRDNFGDITNLGNIFYQEAYPIHKITKKGVILDVGANIGLAAAWFNYHNPDLEIYCFEPLEENAQLIQKNCPDANIHNVAIGSISQDVEMMVDLNSVMASTIPRTISTEVKTFRVDTLDHHLQHHIKDQIALLKIDVEGMELDVLNGGTETIRKTRMVVLETHGHERHKACLESLRNEGFEIKREKFSTNTGLILGER